MQNVGRFIVSNHLPPNPSIRVETGPGWEYVRLINNSAYLLSVNFSGIGAIDFPEMFLEDVYLPQGYRGVMDITPFANMSNIGFSPSNLLSVNLYQQGEISSPQAQPMTFLSNVGNTVNTSGGVAAQIVNTGNTAGSSVIQTQPTGDAGTTLSILNDGTILLGDTSHPGKLTLAGAGNPAIDLSAAAIVQAIKFKVGSLTAWNIFTGSANSSGTLQAHGLGVKPDFVSLQETGTAGDTNTFSWDVAASDATNIKVWSLNATARPYIALAIKK